MRRPLRIGMTGGIGSGKSTVSQYFRELGVTVMDADEVTRELTARGQPALEEIRRVFGDMAIDDQGELSRVFLRSRIFTNDEQRRQLEAILHPRVYDYLASNSDTLQEPYVIWVIPLLLETDASDRVDRVLVIDCPESVQKQRAMVRDKQSDTEINRIMSRQVSRQIRLQQADDIILNDNNQTDLKAQVADLHRSYLALATGNNDIETSTT